MDSNSANRGNRKNDNSNQGGRGNARRVGNKQAPHNATFRRLIYKNTVGHTVGATMIPTTVPQEHREIGTTRRALLKNEGLRLSAKKTRDGGRQNKTKCEQVT